MNATERKALVEKYRMYFEVRNISFLWKIYGYGKTQKVLDEVEVALDGILKEVLDGKGVF